MKTTDEFDARFEALGPRLAAWMASTAPTREPAGVVDGALARSARVRQRPAGLVRLGPWLPKPAPTGVSRRVQLALLAGLVLVGAGSAWAVGARLLNLRSHVTGPSGSLIVLVPDGSGPGPIRVIRPDGLVVGEVQGSTNGCRRHVLVADGMSVAFTFQGLPLKIAPLDGSDPVVVRSAGFFGGTFSPDRTRYAYLDGTADAANLVVVSLLDGTARTVARGLRGTEQYALAWSVNDTLAIGITSGTQNGIDLIEADGTNQRPLVRKPRAELPGPYMNLMWSPDGTRLAYASTRGLSNGNTWLVDLATGRSTLLATADGQPVNPWRGIANTATLIWSPDGRLVTYVAKISDEEYELALLDLSTGESRTLPKLWSAEAWAPDGSRFAFLAPGGGLLTTMRADLSGRVDQSVELTAMAIAWSPDSRQIAVLSPTSLDLLDPAGMQPPARISNEGSSRKGSCMTWSEFQTP